MESRILSFIKNHHVLGCSFQKADATYSFSAFYHFLEDNPRFLISSKEDTLHVRLSSKNPKISGTIHLETKEIGKIQGIQFLGIWRDSSKKEIQEYLKRYPYALALNPKFFTIDITYIKYTDNRLGFGKKLEFGDIQL